MAWVNQHSAYAFVFFGAAIQQGVGWAIANKRFAPWWIISEHQYHTVEVDLNLSSAVSSGLKVFCT